MTTNMPLTVLNIRRILRDEPARDKLAAAIVNTTDVTFVPANPSLYRQGLRIEFNDGDAPGPGAEQTHVSSVDPDTPLITMLARAMYSSTATTHLIDTQILMEPRYPYDLVSQAVNTVLDSELFTEGIYEIVEHQITPHLGTEGPDYDAPSVNCEEWLSVYQIPPGAIEPWYLGGFSKLPKNVDTADYPTGKLFAIWENAGIPGDAASAYRVNCKHRLAIDTISPQQERIVQLLACAHLMEWSEPRRLQGPTNQGDRTVRPLDGVRLAADYREKAKRLINLERAYLRPYAFAGRRFVKVD
jgi:hypothetical protein